MFSRFFIRLLAISPYLEIVFRFIYWRFFRFVLKLSRKRRQNNDAKPLDFALIEVFLKNIGMEDTELVLMHSAYGPLRGSGLSPKEVLEKLLKIVGSSGTLAMPAMPKFKNSPSINNYLTDDAEEYEFNVQKTPIKTGILPYYLHRLNGSVRSRHPINNMVAAGPLADYLMADNLMNNNSLPCGLNSAWAKCVDKDALIIGLGVDLVHSLTAIHVAEDTMADWPLQPWYRKKVFNIVDGEWSDRFELKERDPKWGTLYFAERTLWRDLLKADILKISVIQGVQIEYLFANDLIKYLNGRNKTGYPYYRILK
jgi:aminoglycoside 3-N-acetyltransferase